MKKWLAILGIITCVFSLTACGSDSQLEGLPLDEQTNASMIQAGEEVVDYISDLNAQGAESESQEDPLLQSALKSWESSVDEIGEVLGYQNEYAVYSDDNEISINIGIDGSDHDANVVLIVDVTSSGQELQSVTTNVDYTFGELMKQAALNTLLGMGTTFVVLIILALLISCFKFIPNLLGAFSRKPVKQEEKKAEPAPAPAPVEEELADDGELVAVIAAAVAAYEGTATDGFFVRSIRKSRKR